MLEISAAQLTALARIKFCGLDVFTGDPLEDGAMAHLNLVPPAWIRVNIATVRWLIRAGLIRVLSPDDGEYTRDDIWVITSEGEGVLKQHREYLESAGRESALWRGQAILRELAIVQGSAARRTTRS